MSQFLIGSDIKLMRARYNEALDMQGLPAKYQFPNIADTNTQGEPMIDSYSELIDTHIFLDSDINVRTLKRMGWLVANDQNLPFMIHCSWDLPHVQKDSIFRIAGLYTDLPERVFRVTEIQYSLQAADHLMCSVIPVYDENNITGRTPVEVKKTYNKSNHFLKSETDYRGNYHTVKTDKE